VAKKEKRMLPTFKKHMTPPYETASIKYPVTSVRRWGGGGDCLAKKKNTQTDRRKAGKRAPISAMERPPNFLSNKKCVRTSKKKERLTCRSAEGVAWATNKHSGVYPGGNQKRTQAKGDKGTGRKGGQLMCEI